MLRLAILLSLAAGAAQADCPGPGDLATGIRLLGNDGTSDTYRQHAEHLVQGVFSDGGSSGTVYMLMQGIYAIEVFQTENGTPVAGTRQTYSYPLGPGEVPMPQPGGRWDTIALILEEGAEVRRQAESFVFGDATRVTLGACGYDMIPITAIYHDDDGYQERLHYLPELGFAYLASSQVRGQQPEPVVYFGIEKVTQ